jgi:MFS family permease
MRIRLGAWFGRFWAGQATTELATEIGAFAIPVLAVIQLHASPVEVGLVGVALWLPFLVFALPLGVIVDRVRRRPLLVYAALGRMVFAAAIAITALSGTLTIPILVALALGLGVWVVLFEVTYQSFLPGLVRGDQLEPANSRLQSTAAASQIAGPGLGGLLVRWLSAGGAISFQAALYAFSAAFLASVPERKPPLRASRRSFWFELREGVHVLVHDRYLLPLAGYSGTSNLFAQWITVLITIYAIRTLDIGAGGLGLAFSIGASGALLGAATVGAISRRLGTGRAMLLFTIVDCLALAAIPLLTAAMQPALIIALLAGLYFLSGVGAAATTVQAITIRQLRVEDTMLGRVTAGIRSISFGAVAIGAGLGGLAGEILGLRGGLVVGGGGYLLTIAWVAFTPLARIHKNHDVLDTPPSPMSEP